MKLLGHSIAPNARRVSIYLLEKGIALDAYHVDIMQGAALTKNFDNMNPFHQVPVLLFDDGSVITESVAICRYFEEMHPIKPLFGQTARERAHVEMWQRRAELHVFNMVAQVFRHLHPAMEQLEVPQVPHWAEACRQKLSQALPIFDRQLQENTFLAGDRLTICDITLGCALEFSKLARVEIPANYENLHAYWQRVQQRRSFSEKLKLLQWEDEAALQQAQTA